MARQIHRWIMTVFVLLLLYWAASGLLLNIYDATDSKAAFAREGGGAGAAAPTNLMGLNLRRARGLAPTDLDSSVPAAIKAVRVMVPGDTIASIELHLTGDTVQATVTTEGTPAHRFVVEEPSGAVTEARALTADPAGTFPGWHTVIKRWHRGLVFGTFGAAVSFLSGCALIVLVVSGITLYFVLWQSRRRRGRAAWIWS